MAFLEQRRLEEEELGQKALLDCKNREQNDKKMAIDVANGPFQLGVPLKKEEPIIEIRTIQDEERRVTIEGFVFDVEVKELRSGRSLLTAKVTDYTDSILVKMFSRDKEDAQMMATSSKGYVDKGKRICTKRYICSRSDHYGARYVGDKSCHPITIQRKRNEWNYICTTPMSAMDAVSSVSSIVSQAAKWGHKAIAITDHANVQSFPEAYAAGKKNGIKILYGLEANLVHDGVPIAYEEQHTKLEDATLYCF